MHSYPEVILIFTLTTLSLNAVGSTLNSNNPSDKNVHKSQYELPDTVSGDHHAVRERRDGYGGYSGYGGYGGGGSYGCYCPYQQCDTNSDMLLYFSAGVLLGLLFTMLQPAVMMMAATGGGRKQPLDSSRSSSFKLSDLPSLMSNDIAPLVVDMINVYSRGSKMPDCGRRWLCEVTQKSLKQGGLRARLTSLSSVAVSWFMKDMMPFLENLTEDDNGEAFDCSILGPECRNFFETESTTSAMTGKESAHHGKI